MATGDHLDSYTYSTLGAAPGTLINTDTSNWYINTTSSSAVGNAALYNAYLQLSQGGMQIIPNEQQGETTLKAIKSAVHAIKAETVSEETRAAATDKAARLKKLGLTAQAMIIDNEVKARIRLARIKEWDYKVLPAEAIGEFAHSHRMTATKDGFKVHIDPLDKYIGVVEGATNSANEVKDKIIPDFVLDKLEEAQSRQVFDEYAVLWLERVKDPLLLGRIKELSDFFLIAEWGDDIKFDDIVKEKKPKKK